MIRDDTALMMSYLLGIGSNQEQVKGYGIFRAVVFKRINRLTLFFNEYFKQEIFDDVEMFGINFMQRRFLIPLILYHTTDAATLYKLAPYIKLAHLHYLISCIRFRMPTYALKRSFLKYGGTKGQFVAFKQLSMLAKSQGLNLHELHHLKGSLNPVQEQMKEQIANYYSFGYWGKK